MSSNETPKISMLLTEVEDSHLKLSFSEKEFILSPQEAVAMSSDILKAILSIAAKNGVIHLLANVIDISDSTPIKKELIN